MGARALLREVGRRLLREEGDREWQSALRRISGILALGKFEEFLASLMEARSALRALLESSDARQETVARLREVLDLEGKNYEEDEAITKALFNLSKNKKEAFLKTAQILQDDGKKTDKKHGAAIKRFLSASSSEEKEIARPSYVEVFLTQEMHPRKKIVTNPIKKKHPDMAAMLESQQAGVFQIIKDSLADRDARLTESILLFAQRFFKMFDEEKTRRALLDFDDLIQNAMALLERPDVAPWILYKLDGGIDHILLDEAQDTAPDQWRVIGALAEEFFVGESARELKRTLFVVGDAKQSIFSFQGADLENFHKMGRLFKARARRFGHGVAGGQSFPFFSRAAPASQSD